MNLPEIVNELKIILDIDYSRLASICRMSELSLLIALKLNQPIIGKFKRFEALYKVITYIISIEKEIAPLTILFNGRIIICPDETHDDEDDLTISLCGYINEFYDELDFSAVVLEAVAEYKEYLRTVENI